MKPYVLYFKQCPGVQTPRHFKIGITALARARTRLATYQNAVGPVWEEKFIKIWIGNEDHIRQSEKWFKRKFKDKISSAEAGLSEWICEIELSELLQFIENLRNNYHVKFIDIPEKFQPLTMPLCQELAEWYDEKFDKV
jgi:hypothetical protein